MEAEPLTAAPGPERQLDPALLPFLEAADEVEASRHLEQLFREGDPAIQGILRRKEWSASSRAAVRRNDEVHSSPKT
jgi:hypothetical protein